MEKKGISTTKSDFYIIDDTIHYYLIETNILKELVKNNNFKMNKTRDITTIGYLVATNIIIERSLIISYSLFIRFNLSETYLFSTRKFGRFKDIIYKNSSSVTSK